MRLRHENGGREATGREQDSGTGLRNGILNQNSDQQTGRALRGLQRPCKRAFTMRFAQQAFGFLRALAATRCNAQFTLQIAKGARAGINATADIAFSDAVADTDIHGI